MESIVVLLFFLFQMTLVDLRLLVVEDNLYLIEEELWLSIVSEK